MLAPETIEAFIRGERAAFDEVLRTYAHTVRRVVATFWRGAFDQEEAMQEVWLHIWKNRGAFDAGRAQEIAGFIAVLARRRCIDLLRKTRPEVSLDGDAVEPPMAEPVPDPVEKAELDRAVAAFAGSLAPAWRAFFDLHFVQGLPYDDVVARLSIGKLRCKYMKKVLAARAREDAGLRAVLARRSGGTRDAS